MHIACCPQRRSIERNMYVLFSLSHDTERDLIGLPDLAILAPDDGARVKTMSSTLVTDKQFSHQWLSCHNDLLGRSSLDPGYYGISRTLFPILINEGTNPCLSSLALASGSSSAGHICPGTFYDALVLPALRKENAQATLYKRCVQKSADHGSYKTCKPTYCRFRLTLHLPGLH